MRHRQHPRSRHRARFRGGGHRPARVSEACRNRFAGLIADRYGLPTALTAMPIACGAAAVVFWYGSGHYVSDCDAVASPRTTGGDS
jgi:hypothetical protein